MIRVATLLTFLFLVVHGHAQAETFKKCQDADGKWHYGDQAAEVCELSKITELDASGVTLNQISAPATEEELQAKQRMEHKLVEQQRLDDEQKALDQRLLATYDDHKSIIRTRDAMLAAIDSAIEADQSLKEQLDKELATVITNSGEDAGEKTDELKLRIEQFEKSIRDRLATRELTRERYDLQLSRFQELTQQ